jgi:hypothetical protein
MLAAHGVKRVWELLEPGWPEPECEMDLTLCTFGTSEGYYTSPSFDWLVYRSHEHSIALAGNWLVDAVKQAWPGWARPRGDG